MNTFRLATLSIATSLGLLLVSSSSYAQLAPPAQSPTTSVDRSFDPAAKDCKDVKWSQAALEAFPSIGSACQSVEQRNGRTFVKLEGTVESVRNGGKRIRVDFDQGEDLSFMPSQQMALYLDGKRTPFSELDDGMRLNFYIPEDRLQAELQPDPARIAFVVIPLNMPLDSASAPGANANLSAMNQLPATASWWPWVGAGGGVLLLLGSGLTLRRRFQR